MFVHYDQMVRAIVSTRGQYPYPLSCTPGTGGDQEGLLEVYWGWADAASAGD